LCLFEGNPQDFACAEPKIVFLGMILDCYSMFELWEAHLVGFKHIFCYSNPKTARSINRVSLTGEDDNMT
jgi:hypothetical protein